MKTFLGKKLLFVVAHPDDESFTSGGTMLKNRQAGGQNFLICATLGERGKSHLTRPVSDSQLKQIRKKELLAVAKFLKLDGVYFLNLPDTKVAQNLKKMISKTEALVKKIQPDYILSFGPDGISGHLDHIAAGAAAKQLAKKHRIPFVAFAGSPALRKNFNKVTKRRVHGKYAVTVNHAPHNLKIKVDFKQKLKALKFHKSQFGQSTMFAHMPKTVRNGFLVYEYFITK